MRRRGDKLVRISAKTAATLEELRALGRNGWRMSFRSLDDAIGRLAREELSRQRPAAVNTYQAGVNTRSVVNTELARQECEWCGRVVPPRRRDTGFCRRACARSQHRADVASAASERDYLASVGLA